MSTLLKIWAFILEVLCCIRECPKIPSPLCWTRCERNSKGWKAYSLSFVGRVALAQSALINILKYVFQSSLLPASICDEDEKICCDFIWGSTADSRKCHLLAWEKLCCPEEKGGLGFG